MKSLLSSSGAEDPGQAMTAALLDWTTCFEDVSSAAVNRNDGKTVDLHRASSPVGNFLLRRAKMKRSLAASTTEDVQKKKQTRRNSLHYETSVPRVRLRSALINGRLACSYG